MGIFDDINKVQLLGNVTKDPEVKYTNNGTAVVNVDVATNRSYKHNDEWKKETDYHKVVLWSKLAEQVERYIKKGTRVIIEGRLTTRTYEDKEGNKKYVTEIVASDLVLVKNYKGDDERAQEKEVEKIVDEALDENTPVETSNDDLEDDDLPF